MKRIIALILVLCTVCAVFAGCGKDDNSSSSEPSEQSSSTESSVPEEFTFVDEYFSSAAEYDSSKISKGLEKMNIDSSYKIAILDTDELVVNTAAENLQKYLKKAGADCEIVKTSEVGTKQIILSFNGTSDTQSKFFSDNAFDVCSVNAENDAFNMRQVGDNIIIAGSNPRSVLYGVYEFEDHFMYEPDEKIDSFVTWAFRKRGSGFGFYWSGSDFVDAKYFEEKAEYLSRLGMNMYTALSDGSGIPTIINSFVHSDIFPFQTEPKEIYKEQLKAISAACKKYGIDYYQWLTDPALPYLVGGDMSQYPAEALGVTDVPSWVTVKAPEMSKTICIHSELGQQYMTEMMQKFVTEYPDVAGAFIYNNDSNSFLCVPEKCEHCKQVITSNTASMNNWKMFSDAINIYAKAAHEIDPDFRIMVLPAVHNDYGELTYILANTEFDDITIGFDGGDHCPMVTKSSSLTEARVEKCIKYAKKNENKNCFIYHSFNRNESVPQNFLFLVSEAISAKQFYDQGFDCVNDSAGATPECNSMNALLLKELLRDPTQDHDALIKKICIEQLGNAAGNLTYEAVLHIGNALETWSSSTYYPFRGSIGFMGIGSMLNEMTPGVLPEIKAYIEGSFHVPSLNDEFFSNYKTTASELKTATDLLQQAMDAASSDQYIKYAYYTDPDVARPNCKQYAELQYASTVFGRYYAQFQVNRLEAWKLLCEVDDFSKVSQGIDDGSEAFKQYVELIKKESAEEQEFVDILRGFLQNRDYVVSVSVTQDEIQHFISIATTKIAGYDAYLAKLEK
ncbi:MAG: hypothetical protein J5874_03380 [Oscillospiraceae bacterium]|nr:hypothetical protein [Oscillospiraceae bacterium]